MPTSDVNPENQQPKKHEARPLHNSLFEILAVLPTNPQEDFQRLCASWLKLTGATWAWLWLSHLDNEKHRRWQVISVYAADGQHNRYAPNWPDDAVTDSSIIHYSSISGQPVLVSDISEWRSQIKGQMFAFVAAQEMAHLGTRSLMAVPLEFTVADNNSNAASAYSVVGAMQGVLSLHFTDKSSESAQLETDDYMLLAKATTGAISHSFANEQRRILDRLGIIASRYLATAGSRSGERRQRYVSEVIDLIKERLGVSGVSVFYEATDGDEIECIATTGLYSADGKLPVERLGSIRYKRGEAITGMVFANAEPFVWQGEQSLPRFEDKARWQEASDVEAAKHYWLVWPIRCPAGPDDAAPGATVRGVIRCAGNRSTFRDDRVRAFDPVQLQTLNFISMQIAPVLENMSISIRRERAISIIKHDLYAPLRVIADQAKELQEHLAGHSKRSVEYVASNIQSAVLLASNLVGSLGEQPTFRPSLTRLEGDVIARVRDGLARYAWVENRMKLRYDGFRNIPPLWIDASLVERVITNLLLNAVKYGDEGTDIRMEAAETSDAYVIKVINDGIGVSPEDSERIFEGSYRGREAQSRKIGLGLGLKVARSAMRKHGGDLFLMRPKAPTIFKLTFPKALAISKPAP